MPLKDTMMETIRSRSLKAPDIRLMDLKMPEVKIPAVKLPELKLGEVKLPRLTFEPATRPIPKRRGPNGLSMLAGALGGVALFYFMDPKQGAARRAQAGEKFSAVMARLGGSLNQLGSRAGSNASGLSQKMVHLRSGGTAVDDLTLRDRVESEIFRDSSLPKGQLNLGVESGVVTIRGQVDNAYEIASIEKAILKVRGVNGVENLMHVEGTPAPNKVEAREVSR